jgi:hypothetical protein
VSEFEKGVLAGQIAAADPVPLGDTLNEVAAFVLRFVVLTVAQADVIALWVLHTWAFEAAEVTPFLAITSPEKRCGKTRLMEVLELIVRAPWRAVLPSEAVLYRKIERDRPTLLLDETDAIFAKGSNYEALRSLLNAGNRRGVTVDRATEKGKDLQGFSVFCPKALAGIGELPGTVADRAIPIRLNRRAPSEEVARFYYREVKQEAENVRRRIETWAAGALVNLRDARPVRLHGVDDRAAEGSEPLLGIADMAGKEWSARARQSLIEVYRSKPDDQSLGVSLLADCRTIFDDRLDEDRLSSADLNAALVAIEESPWAEINRGKPLNVRRLARLLNPFGIASGSIRLPDGSTPKGYYRAAFRDAWSRFLPSPGFQSATPPQPAPVLTETCGGSKNEKTHPPQLFANDDGLCGVVADRKPPKGSPDESDHLWGSGSEALSATRDADASLPEPEAGGLMPSGDEEVEWSR